MAGNMLRGPVEHQWPAAEDNQHDWLAGGGDCLQQLFLIAGQVETRARTGLACHGGAIFTERENHQVGLFGGFFCRVKASVRRRQNLCAFRVQKLSVVAIHALLQRRSAG